MISTKDIKTDEGSAGLKSIIVPGNHTIEILSIELQKDEKYGDKLVLKIAQKSNVPDGYKGIQIIKDKPESGNYPYPIGFLHYSRWNFKDDVTPMGFEISRVTEILKAIKSICEELKVGTWFEDVDSKYETIEEFVSEFNKAAPFKGISFYACINGREYMNGTYLNHQLFLPRPDKLLGKPFSINPEKVIKFFESTGIEKLKPKPDPSAGVIDSTGGQNIDKKPAEQPKAETKTEELPDWIEEMNKPVEQTYHKQEPVRAPVTSAAEAAFMNDKSPTPHTDALMNDKMDEGTSGIITMDGPMPWD